MQNNNPFPFPNASKYGLKPFTYPDGTLPDSSYELLGRRNLNNELDWNEPFCNKDLTDEQAENLLATAKQAEADNIVIDPYLIPIEIQAGERRPTEYREYIRATGPSVPIPS